MQGLLEQKFLKGSELRAKLEETRGKLLVEGNWWHDNVYGSCHCLKCGDKGRNELGKMLMRIPCQYLLNNGREDRILLRQEKPCPLEALAPELQGQMFCNFCIFLHRV
jgi:hypothetical protein